jgi:hypothetical protein
VPVVKTYGSFSAVPNTDNWQSPNGSVGSGGLLYVMSEPRNELYISPEGVMRMDGVNLAELALAIAARTGCQVLGLRLHWENAGGHNPVVWDYILGDYVVEAALKNGGSAKSVLSVAQAVADALEGCNMPSFEAEQVQVRLFAGSNSGSGAGTDDGSAGGNGDGGGSGGSGDDVVSVVVDVVQSNWKPLLLAGAVLAVLAVGVYLWRKK